MSATQVAAQDVQLVVFHVAHEAYGVPIAAVREVVPALAYRVTRVPRAPNYLHGVTNLRGRVIPVMDLRRRLHLPVGPVTSATRIAVVDGEAGSVGLLVDAVAEVARVPSSAIEPPSPALVGEDGEVVAGVAKAGNRLVILLEMANLLGRDDRRRVEGSRHATGV